MKRFLTTIIAALCLACAFSAALASSPKITEAEAVLRFRNNLTEVYGLTVEEADSFVIHAEWADGDNVWLVEGWPADHPDWIYTCMIDGDTGLYERSESPFSPNPGWFSYPGEGSVRATVQKMESEHLWNGNLILNGANIVSWFQEREINVNSDLRLTLFNGTATPGFLLHQFFCSCYGDPVLWREATKAWHDELMQSHGIDPEAYTGFAPLEMVGSWQLQRAGLEKNVQKFNDELPAELSFLMDNSHIAEMKLICGVYEKEQNKETDYFSQEFACIFENQAGARMLVYGRMDNQTKEWRTVNAGSRCLPEGIAADIDYDGTNSRIRLQISDDVRMELNIYPGSSGDLFDALLGEIRITNRETGEVIIVSDYGDGANVNVLYADQWDSERYPAHLPASLIWLDSSTMPMDGKGWKEYTGKVLPENTGLTAGAHLRKDHSSHSTDLGIPYSGVIMEILESVPGTEAPWYHVRIGIKEGWMSSNYVRTGSAATAPILARARKDITLKSGTGLFAGKAADLPEGTRMYVIQEEGGAYYVCVPQGELVWPMQVEGTYGYVSKNDVHLALSPAELDWLDE